MSVVVCFVYLVFTLVFTWVWSPASCCLDRRPWPIHISPFFFFFLFLEGTRRYTMAVKLVCGLYVLFHSLAFIAFYLLRISSPCWLSEHLLCYIPAKYISLYLYDTRTIRYYAISARLYRCTPLHLTYVSCSYLLFQSAYKYLSFIRILVLSSPNTQHPTDTGFFSPVRNFFRQQATPCASPRTNNQRIKNRCCEGLNDITMKRKV